MYDALTITDYIILYYKNRNYGVSNLKLQKILYFLQALFLIKKDCELFDEEIEAWGFGPVIPSVYRKYMQFGCMDIPTKDIDEPFIDNETKTIIDSFLEKVKDMSSTYLTDITLHQKPWTQNYIKDKKKIIPKKEIRKYFLKTK